MAKRSGICIWYYKAPGWIKFEITYKKEFIKNTVWQCESFLYKTSTLGNAEFKIKF